MAATREEARNGDWFGGYVLIIDPRRTISRSGVESQRKKLSLRILA